MLRLGATSFSAVLAVLAATSEARGDDSDGPLRLTWIAPAGCPRQAEVHADVERLVGVVPPETPALDARARVLPNRSGGWRLRLSTDFDGSTGERELDGNSCEAVARAAAVMLALMLNPSAQAPQPAQRERPLTLRLGAEGHLGIGFGTLPGPAPQAGLGIVARVPPVWLWISADAALPQHAEVPGDPSRGGDVWLGSATGALCWDVFSEAPPIGACTTAHVHRLAGDGSGISNPQHGVVWWTAAGAGIVARLPLSAAIEAQAGLEAAVPLARPTLYVEDLGQVHRPGEFEASFEIGAVFHLP